MSIIKDINNALFPSKPDKSGKGSKSGADGAGASAGGSPPITDSRAGVAADKADISPAARELLKLQQESVDIRESLNSDEADAVNEQLLLSLREKIAAGEYPDAATLEKLVDVLQNLPALNSSDL